jgi:hypothetical protein
LNIQRYVVDDVHATVLARLCISKARKTRMFDSGPKASSTEQISVVFATMAVYC